MISKSMNMEREFEQLADTKLDEFRAVREEAERQICRD